LLLGAVHVTEFWLIFESSPYPVVLTQLSSSFEPFTALTVAVIFTLSPGATADLLILIVTVGFWGAGADSFVSGSIGFFKLLSPHPNDINTILTHIINMLNLDFQFIFIKKATGTPLFTKSRLPFPPY
jgi:hypothetical protein